MWCEAMWSYTYDVSGCLSMDATHIPVTVFAELYQHNRCARNKLLLLLLLFIHIVFTLIRV